jgi:hypothetical protein
MPQPYNTETNTIRQRKYRENHREAYAEYQRKYKEENYNNPTIRLAQVRENLRRAKLAVVKWEQAEAQLIEAQKKMQQERLTNPTTLGDWMQGAQK